MTGTHRIAQTSAQAVVFLESLAAIVQKSPVAYSAQAADDLAAHIRGMAEAVSTDARLSPAELATTRQYAALDWHNESVAVLFAAEHRTTFHQQQPVGRPPEGGRPTSDKGDRSMTQTTVNQPHAEDVEGFPARDLMDAMKAEGLDLLIGHTGGGTATLYLQSEGSHTFLIGPGSYLWNDPLDSRFTTAELYYGPDHYDDDGAPVEFPDEEEKTITPGTTTAAIANEVAANFRRFNTARNRQRQTNSGT